MHPAYSVIFFTTLSGLGYGLLALLGVLGAFGVLAADRWFGLVAFSTAFAAITLGLLSSTIHLGHPERAWRAFSQWRSSWLSREGVLAVATYVPAGLFAIGWIVLERNGGAWGVVGIAVAVFSALTVFATGMIYASLKPIRQWRNPLVAPIYLALALMTGVLWLNALVKLFGMSRGAVDAIAVLAVFLGGGLKLVYWRAIDKGSSISTPETATGLGAFGKVRLLDAPHTEDNYLMKEMGFRIARKHARRLRRIAFAAAFIAPLALTVAAWFGEAMAVVADLAALLAAVLAVAGLLIERWLFFAEAKHSMTLYYGATGV